MLKILRANADTDLSFGKSKCARGIFGCIEDYSEVLGGDSSDYRRIFNINGQSVSPERIIVSHIYGWEM